MANNIERLESKQNGAETKKENIFKRGLKWTKSHGRDIAVGTALVLSVVNTAILVMANCGGIDAEIQADNAIESTGETMDVSVE